MYKVNVKSKKAFAVALLEIESKSEHRIFVNGQGGYDCECGSRWDWQASEKIAAYMHAKLNLIDDLLNAKIIEKVTLSGLEAKTENVLPLP